MEIQGCEGVEALRVASGLSPELIEGFDPEPLDTLGAFGEPTFHVRDSNASDWT